MKQVEWIASEFEEKGYVVLPDFVAADELRLLNGEIERHYRPLVPDANELLASSDTVMKQFECDVICWDPCGESSAPFLALRDSPALASATRACLGEGFSEPGSMVMWAAPGGRGQSWHQDCLPQQPGQFNLNRLFYTENVTLADGAIVVVPGSHKMGRIPPGGLQDTIEGEVVLTPTAGTLVLLHGNVYHRVTPNSSGKPRLSVNFRAFPQGGSPDVCAFGVYRNGTINFHTGQVVAAEA